MRIAHQTGSCKSGDVTISYRRLGKPGRTPLLFVHGLSYFSYDWLEAAAALASDRECVAMDQRGFGDSGWSKDYSVAAMAADIGNLLEHLAWPRAIVVGHSMGGRNSAYFAAKNPQRAAGLVLVDYSPENAPAGSKRVAQTVSAVPETFASIDEAMRYFAGKNRERFEAYLRPVAGGYAIKRDTHFRDQFRKVLETGERPKLGVDMWQALAAVKCPTLVVRGSRSDLFAAETAKKFPPSFNLVEVDAGHDVAGDNLPGFLEATRPFLMKIDAPPTRGIDHLAIVADDMPVAMDFYTRVMGFRLLHARRVPFEQDRWQPPYDNLRHYFFDMGNDSLFAVFEYPKGLPRQDRDRVGGMQHVAFHVPFEKFDAMIAHVKSCSVSVVGPVPLGGRFWSAYFLDPFGIRLEIATSRTATPMSNVESVLQTEEEARAELETLFSDPAEVEKWLRHMPLRKEPVAA